MQIHEITKRSLREGLLGNIGRGVASGLTGMDIPQSQASIDKNAAASAAKLQAQGYGKPAKLPTVQQAVADVQKNPAQQQYIKSLVSQWKQAAPDASTARPKVQTPAGTRPKASAADPNWRQDALKSAGAAFDQAPAARPAPGQMPALVAASAQGQRMMQAYGKPRGGVQSVEEAPEEYTTPGGIVVPGGAKTDQAPGSSVPPVSGNKYKEDFLTWAAEKLRTVEPSTRQTITLDLILQTDIKDELDRALSQVVATAGDAQKNATAVNNYLTIAVAGIARKSKELKMNYGRGGEAGAVPTGQAGRGIVTQQEIRNKLADAGVNTNQLEKLKPLFQNPADRQALLKSFGVQV